MNTDLMFSSKSDLWETPQAFFDSLNLKYQFELDVCALPENAKCKKYFTPSDDGLKQTWSGICWMNPPYGSVISKWIQKAYSESRKANVTVVALLPARTDTKYFHEYIYQKEGVDVNFITGRLKFGNQKNSAPFPSMLVVFNKE